MSQKSLGLRWGAAAWRRRPQAGDHAPTPEAISAASGFGSPPSAPTSGMNLTYLRAEAATGRTMAGPGEEGCPCWATAWLGNKQAAVWWLGLTPGFQLKWKVGKIRAAEAQPASPPRAGRAGALGGSW